MDNEVEKFEQYSASWWDRQGKEFGLLHQINPLRIEFIKKHLLAHFAITEVSNPLAGLSILDIGCGGGLATIALNRLGAKVTGIDPSPGAIAAANKRVNQLGLKDIEHICSMPKDFVASEKFDAVLCLDVLEHVDDLQESCGLIAKFAKPEGALFISTINKTIKALLLGIITAEYLLRMLPKGTHSYEKFLPPAELEKAFAKTGFSIKALSGINFSLLSTRWVASSNISINYLAYLSNKAL